MYSAQINNIDFEFSLNENETLIMTDNVVIILRIVDGVRYYMYRSWCSGVRLYFSLNQFENGYLNSLFDSLYNLSFLRKKSTALGINKEIINIYHRLLKNEK